VGQGIGGVGPVDLTRLAVWLADQGLGDGPLRDAETVGGGSQNVLVRFRYGRSDLVLRRPPPHKRDNSDETMRREARVLAALAGTDVPHPRLVAACDDIEPLGAAFYVMEAVPGYNAMAGLPPDIADPAFVRRMGFALVEGIAGLGRVDHVAVGLEGFGRPEGWLERQVSRWRAHLDGYGALDGYPGPSIGDADRVGRWLDSHRPAAWRPGILHGDYHFGNVLYAPDSPELAAIVDWELSTVGDPLLDLGHLLTTWPQQFSSPDALMLDIPNLPDRQELIAHYGGCSDRDVSRAGWYQVLACYRLGIILEGTYARACAGLAPVETGDRLHAKACALFSQASALISAGVA
jgi:aminoglycoside phosphotransferase (APT) family kinase protein